MIITNCFGINSWIYFLLAVIILNYNSLSVSLSSWRCGLLMRLVDRALPTIRFLRSLCQSLALLRTMFRALSKHFKTHSIRSNMLRTLNTVTHFVHNPQGHTRNPQAFLQEEKSTGMFHWPVEDPSSCQGWNVTKSPPF